MRKRAITWELVDRIRRDAKARFTTYRIAKWYGLNVGSVHSIVTEQTWKPESRPNEGRYAANH